MSDTLQVRVKSIVHEAEGICSFELRPASPLHDLPPFTAGAHIDLHLPNGLIRSYSLHNSPGETHRYVIGVNKDANSRGGSQYLHEVVRPGDVLTISRPRNNFALDEQAPHTVLIGGGIGITPLWSMIQRLEAIGRPWTLHYAARTRRNAAFLTELQALERDQASRVHLAFDAEPGAVMLDLDAIVGRVPDDAHLYCCGPVPMIQAFERSTASRPGGTVHVEYFAAKEKPSTQGGFEIQLARSGRTISVCAGFSILESLLSAGVDVPYSCQEGVCGTCEVAVLSGVPEHRDLVLSQVERDANNVMMICCSGSKSEKLVLDL